MVTHSAGPGIWSTRPLLWALSPAQGSPSPDVPESQRRVSVSQVNSLLTSWTTMFPAAHTQNTRPSGQISAV